MFHFVIRGFCAGNTFINECREELSVMNYVINVPTLLVSFLDNQ